MTVGVEGAFYFLEIVEKKSECLPPSTNGTVVLDGRAGPVRLREFPKLSRVIRNEQCRWMGPRCKRVDDELDKTTRAFPQSVTSLTVLPLDTEELGGLRRERRRWSFQEGLPT